MRLYYRMRTCTSDTLNERCSGSTIKSELEMHNSNPIWLTATDGTIELKLNQAITGTGCKLFTPVI